MDTELTSTEIAQRQQAAQDALFRELMAQKAKLAADLHNAEVENKLLRSERDELAKALEIIRAHR